MGEAVRPIAKRVGPAAFTASCADHSLLRPLLMGIQKRRGNRRFDHRVVDDCTVDFGRGEVGLLESTTYLGF